MAWRSAGIRALVDTGVDHDLRLRRSRYQNGCLALFAAWKTAAKPAEIHVYDGISGGFGMTKRDHPVDGWTDRLHEWLVARELTRRVNIAR